MTPASPPRRWRRRLGFLTLLAVAAPLLYAWWADREAEARLAAVIAETDRLDPRWREEELVDPQPEPPDGENGALQFLAAHQLAALGWPNQFAAHRRAIWDQLARTPRGPLPPAEEAFLRTWLPAGAAAVTAARRMADFPHGRLPRAVREGRGSLMPAFTNRSAVTDWLWCDLQLRLADRDTAGAVTTVRALINGERALGVERSFMVMLFRLNFRGRWHAALERHLAQAEPAEAALAALQRQIEEVAEEPILLHAWRGGRAETFRFLNDLHTREGAAGLAREVAPPRVQTGWAWADQVLQPLDARLAIGHPARLLADWLEMETHLVEIAKAPAHRQPALAAAFRAKLARRSVFLSGSEGILVYWRQYHQSVVRLRAAAAGLAAERFRRARQRWPADVGELVPAYLAQVPLDPADGRPLRLRPTADGLILYSVGLEGKDDGTRLDRNAVPQPNAGGYGFQLWNPPRP